MSSINEVPALAQIKSVIFFSFFFSGIPTKKMTQSSCSLFKDEPEKCETISAVHKTFSSLSLISCFSVGVLILLMGEQKILVQKMILFLVFSAFFSSISYLLGNVDSSDSHGCRFQSFMMQYFDWATLLWVLMISINMLLVVKNISFKRKYLCYHAAVWFGALFWSVIPFFEDTYGHAGLWCWIKKDYPGYRFGTWFGPLIFTCVSMCIIFLYVIMYVYQATRAQSGATAEMENRNKRYRTELRPLLFYPLIYVILSIPTFMYRIDDESHPDKAPNYALLIIAAIFSPSKGSAMSIIFSIVNIKLIQNLTWKKLKNQLMLCFKRENQAQVTHNIQLEDQSCTEKSSVPKMSPQMTTISLD